SPFPGSSGRLRAARVFSGPHELDFSEVQSRLMGLFDRVLSLFGKKPAVRESAPQVLALAEDHRRSGRFGEAIDSLKEGAEANPTYVGIHVALGRVYAQAGRLDEALDAFHRALSFDREN